MGRHDRDRNRRFPATARRPGRAARPQPASPRAPVDPIGALNAALDRRAALIADETIDCCRVMHDAADGIDGFVLERFGPALIAQFHEGRLRVDEGGVRKLCEQAMRRLGCRATYRKLFPRERGAAARPLDPQHRDPQPWIGQPLEEEFAVRERGAAWRIRPYDGYSVGLFLENRENRSLVRRLAAGRTVLNAFAYTCAFSVCAALGKAAATVSVDVSKRNLEWGKRNFAANGLPLDGHWFIASDIFDYYRRAQRQGRMFDMVILDAPSFGRDKATRSVFSLRTDMDRLVAGAIERLNPGGLVLLTVNHRPMQRSRMESSLVEMSALRACELLDPPPLPPDFAGDPEYSKSVVARID